MLLKPTAKNINLNHLSFSSFFTISFYLSLFLIIFFLFLLYFVWRGNFESKRYSNKTWKKRRSRSSLQYPKEMISVLGYRIEWMKNKNNNHKTEYPKITIFFVYSACGAIKRMKYKIHIFFQHRT